MTLSLKSSQPWTIFNHNMKSIWTTFVVDKKSQSAGVAMSSVTSHAGLIVVKDAFPPLHLVLLGDKWGDRQGDVATNVPGQGDIPGCRLWTSHHWAPNVPGASLHEVCTFRMSQLAVRPQRVIEWLIWTPWTETLREAPFWNVVPVFGLRPFGGEGLETLALMVCCFFHIQMGNFLFQRVSEHEPQFKKGRPNRKSQKGPVKENVHLTGWPLTMHWWPTKSNLGDLDEIGEWGLGTKGLEGRQGCQGDQGDWVYK